MFSSLLSLPENYILKEIISFYACRVDNINTLCIAVGAVLPDSLPKRSDLPMTWDMKLFI